MIIFWVVTHQLFNFYPAPPETKKIIVYEENDDLSHNNQWKHHGLRIFFQPKLGFNSPVAVPPYWGMLFLYKLRAFENVVEWLPVFIIHAVALVALGKTGTCVLLCVPYTIGCLVFSGGKAGKIWENG